jgi:hypothetical protein
LKEIAHDAIQDRSRQEESAQGHQEDGKDYERGG